MILLSPDEVKAAGTKVRRLVLPVDVGEHGERLPCPLKVGKCFRVQYAPTVKGKPLTAYEIHLIERDESPPTPFVGTYTTGERVWLVEFVNGDRSQFHRDQAERYLSRNGITTDPRFALKTEPAVTTQEHLDEAQDRRLKRERLQEEEFAAHAAAIEAALKALSSDSAHRQDARFMEKRLAAMKRRRAERAAVS